MAVTASNQPGLSSRDHPRSDAPRIRGSRDGRAIVAGGGKPRPGIAHVKLVSWFLKANEDRHRDAALEYERSHASGVVLSVREKHDLARRALGSADGLLLGMLESGQELRVRLDTFDRHNVILGATGSGKTRAIIDRLMRRAALGLRTGFEFELFDPKTETFAEVKKHVAAWWLGADAATRDEITRAVHVIDWTRDRITPTAPYDNSDAAMTDAYAAELHTRVTIEASDVSYSARSGSSSSCGVTY